MRRLNLVLPDRAIQLAGIVLASFGVGCSDADVPVPGGALPVEGEPGGAEMDVLRYDLKGDYDWDRGRLLATVDVTLSPAGDGTDTVVLQSAVTEVTGVRLAGGSDLPFSTDEATQELRVDVSSLPGVTGDAVITLAIDYETEPSSSFLAVLGRKGDPLKDIRVLATMSEPQNAQNWMPCHDVPADRALFSIDMGMAGAETMIANGDLVADEPGDDGSRRMKYQTGYTLPTYLMAFAISDFEVKNATTSGVPVSIWHRRGLPGEHEAVLEELVGMIAHIEALLGPYPFEKYALVHVPMLPASGIENAGITFQAEGAGATTMGAELTLTAHELGHQWFGDLVTLESWDDVWIKEGMASLLEQEATRGHTDKDGPLTLNGDYLWVMEGDAIRDTSLAPADKYNSGVYGRAAWLMTQIRGLLGEETFWKTLRGVLEQHRFGTIGTDAFVEAFAEALGPEATARMRSAIDAKSLPTLEVKRTASGSPTLTVHDPEGTLVAPIAIGWVAEDGSMRQETLVVDEPLELVPKQSGEFLILDPLDHHLTLDSFLVEEEAFAALQESVIPLLTPTTPAGNARFLDIGSAHQDPVVAASLPGVSPEGFEAFVAALDSDWTKTLALQTACAVASDPELDPLTAAAWTSVLESALPVAPPPFSLDLIQNGGYGACTMFDPVTAFADEWAQLATGLPSGGIAYTRLSFLTAFEIPAPLALSTWGSVARHSDSAHARWLAAMRLRLYLSGLDPADAPVWRALFVELLSTTEDAQVLGQAIRAVVKMASPTAAENADALAGLEVMLHSPWTRSAHSRAVCAAFTLTQGDAATWQTFADGLEGAPLNPEAAERLVDPSLCP